VEVAGSESDSTKDGKALWRSAFAGVKLEKDVRATSKNPRYPWRHSTSKSVPGMQREAYLEPGDDHRWKTGRCRQALNQLADADDVKKVTLLSNVLGESREGVNGRHSGKHPAASPAI